MEKGSGSPNPVEWTGFVNALRLEEIRSMAVQSVTIFFREMVLVVPQVGRLIDNGGERRPEGRGDDGPAFVWGFPSHPDTKVAKSDVCPKSKPARGRSR